jgi:hypothetical protein
MQLYELGLVDNVAYCRLCKQLLAPGIFSLARVTLIELI